MTKLSPIRCLLALLPLALLLAMSATASADTYQSTWNGGHLIATANADFTEATIESVSVSFDECGKSPEEASCSWRAMATLHSSAEQRCNPATPEDQVVWDSDDQVGNGAISDGAISFPLEGCRGQSLVFSIGFHKTYEEGDEPPTLRIGGGKELWTMFTFGYHPFEEADRAVPTEYNPPPYKSPPFTPNFVPAGLAVASDCRSLTINEVRYVFAFHQMGCRKATSLAQSKNRLGRAPRGYACERRTRGVLCRRIGHPQKYLEWRLPETKPAHSHP